jgi:predicted RNase H-like HicB family nuclease
MTEYPINIHFVPEDDGKGYWFAYLPDFGWSACSATGESALAALGHLRSVQGEVMQHYKEKGKTMPKPSPAPFEKEEEGPKWETEELFDADPDCDHQVKDAPGGGVKCTKCNGWFCY